MTAEAPASVKARRLVLKRIWNGLRIAFAFGLGAGVIGWAADWGLHAWRGDTDPYAPFATIAFVCFAAVAAVALVEAEFLFETVPRWLTPVATMRAVGEYTPMPVWWARWVMLSVLWAAGGFAFAAVMKFGQAVGSRKEDLQIDGLLLAIAIVMGALAGLVQVVAELLSPLIGKAVTTVAKQLDIAALRTDRGWAVRCACLGVAVFVVGGLVSLGAVLLLTPVFEGLHLGSPWRPATAIAISLLLGYMGWGLAREEWQARDRRRQVAEENPMPRASKWFLDCDLPPETSTSGIAPDGHPFYLWRESADNRLGLSRPRYCRLAEFDDDLQFVFFDPSQNRQPTNSVAAAVVGAALVATVLWYTTVKIGFGEISASALSGVAIGGVWHISLVLWRWRSRRYPRDGRILSRPLRTLSGFNIVHAGKLGAKIDGEEAKVGDGLTAVFEDGTMFILTGNAWNYRSIVEYHGDLTNMFRGPRDDLISAFDAKRKAAGRNGNRKSATALSPSSKDIPSSL